MLKKKIGILICIISLLIPMSTASSQWDVSIYCNGSPLASDTPPIISDSHTYVPIGAIADTFGIETQWNDEGKQLTLTKNDLTIDLYMGSTYMEYNHIPYTTYFVPFIYNDRVMVPLRLLSELLEYEVSWDSATSTVYINQPKTIYYNITDDCIDVYSKYSQTQDIMFRIERRGPNDLPDFSQIYLIYNPETSINPDLSDGFLFYHNPTDWHSPFIITADENNDGDNQEELHFTGGYHGYDNTELGSPTASMKLLGYYCDDNTLETSSGSCSKFEIRWTNAVQASNTKLINGTGREVMEEEHSLVFDGKVWYSSVKLRPLENITIHKLYGFQADIRNTWDDFIEYQNSNFNYMLPTIRENSSNALDTSSVLCQKGANALKITLDTSEGLGTREYCSDVDGIFMSSYKKVYFNIVNGVPLRATPDKEYTYKGTYCFYSLQ